MLLKDCTLTVVFNDLPSGSYNVCRNISTICGQHIIDNFDIGVCFHFLLHCFHECFSVQEKYILKVQQKLL